LRIVETWYWDALVLPRFTFRHVCIAPNNGAELLMIRQLRLRALEGDQHHMGLGAQSSRIVNSLSELEFPIHKMWKMNDHE
jgi:hypothetical protein